jgi:hypothetical protein
LSQVAKLGVPSGSSIILSSANTKTGMNRAPTPQFRNMLEKIPIYDRTAITAGEDAEFNQAAKATKRNKLIMNALWTDAIFRAGRSARKLLKFIRRRMLSVEHRLKLTRRAWRVMRVPVRPLFEFFAKSMIPVDTSRVRQVASLRPSQVSTRAVDALPLRQGSITPIPIKVDK